MASERFELFRISLFEREQKTLFSNPDEGRFEYLGRVFLTESTFYTGKIAYTYVYCGDAGEGHLVSKIGRNYLQEENLSPDEGFMDTIHEGYKASVLSVDIKDGVDGQKIAFQIDAKVGNPGKILQSFAEELNKSNRDSKYFIEIHPIIDEKTFWGFVEDNERKIVSLRIDFTAPNGLWTLGKTMKEEVKAASDMLGAQNISTIASNPDGINIESPQIADAIEYASTGSATIRARAKNGAKYNSNNKSKKTILDMADDRKKLIDEITSNFLKVMGHE